MKTIALSALLAALLTAHAYAAEPFETDIRGSVDVEVVDLLAASRSTGCAATGQTAAASVLGGTDVRGQAETFAAYGATQSRATGCLSRACAKSASIGDGCD